MELDYIKDPNCECSKYPDFGSPTCAIQHYGHNVPYVLFGFIHENGQSRECECHKKYRLQKRYKLVASQTGLPSIDMLDEPYVGSESRKAFDHTMMIPTITETHQEYANTIYWMVGGRGTQKTTTVSKMILKAYEMNKFPVYKLFNDVIMLLSSNDNSQILKDIREADYLIIDDAFVADVINFKTSYNLFLTEILKRRRPTIIVTRKQFADLKDNTHYDKDLIEDIEARVSSRNSQLFFNDNVDNIRLKEQGPVDLWSL